jgi:hypothetical protein
MNLTINGIDAIKDVEGARELAINLSERKTSNSWSPSATPVRVYPLREARSSLRLLPSSLTAQAWNIASAALSLNRMAAACGLPLTLCAAPTSISRYR